MMQHEPIGKEFKRVVKPAAEQTVRTEDEHRKEGPMEAKGKIVSYRLRKVNVHELILSGTADCPNNLGNDVMNSSVRPKGFPPCQSFHPAY